MKQFILSALLLGMTIHSIAQYNPPSETDYLAKSKKQKTIAWLMLGGGSFVTIAGYFLFLDESLLGEGVHSTRARLYLAMGYAGVGSVIGSIPLFIAAARNKGMARSGSMGLKMERGPDLLMESKSYPALAITIQLK